MLSSHPVPAWTTCGRQKAQFAYSVNHLVHLLNGQTVDVEAMLTGSDGGRRGRGPTSTMLRHASTSSPSGRLADVAYGKRDWLGEIVACTLALKYPRVGQRQARQQRHPPRQGSRFEPERELSHSARAATLLSHCKGRMMSRNLCSTGSSKHDCHPCPLKLQRRPKEPVPVQIPRHVNEAPAATLAPGLDVNPGPPCLRAPAEDDRNWFADMKRNLGSNPLCSAQPHRRQR